jgi:hypothetical protein
MRFIKLTAALFIAALAFGPQPAHADDRAPWCAVYSIGRGDSYMDCRYRTFEECYPNVISGNRGFCNHNPGYAGELAPVHRYKVHRKRHVNRD